MAKKPTFSPNSMVETAVEEVYRHNVDSPNNVIGSWNACMLRYKTNYGIPSAI